MLINISSYLVKDVLELLLQDKTTGKNIIWATDTFNQIDIETLLQRPDIIRPRIEKSPKEKKERTVKKAEVFTPTWLCNKMNNLYTDKWFGQANVFNIESDNHTWITIKEKIEFPEDRIWQEYVEAQVLEITCGEAPYLVSRYDTTTGVNIPLKQRIGLLDRKIRIVVENTDTYEDWLNWVIKAFESSYGYDYQGDNVLIARINLLMTFIEYHERYWEVRPDDRLLKQIVNIIVWNIWQMDGLTGMIPMEQTLPTKKLTAKQKRVAEQELLEKGTPCIIFDWKHDNIVKFRDLTKYFSSSVKV